MEALTKFMGRRPNSKAFIRALKAPASKNQTFWRRGWGLGWGLCGKGFGMGWWGCGELASVCCGPLLHHIFWG